MNMKYLEISEVVTECRTALEKSMITQVTQHNDRSLIIHSENDKQQSKLLISLQTPFVRVHLTEHQGDKATVPLFNFLNKHLQSLTIIDIKILQNDRILQITMENVDHQYALIAELFSRSPNCYLLDTNNKILFSLVKGDQSTYTPPELQSLPPPPPLSSPVTSAIIEKKYDLLESEFLFERNKTQTRKVLYRQLKKIKRSIDELNEQLADCLNWEKTRHQAELLQANLYKVKKGISKITVDDWLTNEKTSIPLDPALPPHKQAEQLFNKSKKLKKAIEHLPQQIEEREAKHSRLQDQLETLEAIGNQAQLNEFNQRFGLETPPSSPQKKREHKPRLPYRKYISSAGLDILVGKKDKDNDILTFHHANGNDWWLHVSDWPGSHVVIKTPKNTEPDKTTLNEACQLAIAHSKAKNQGGAEVVITQQKYLKKVKGNKPGKVFLSNHTSKWVQFDSKIIQKLKKG